MKIIDTVVLIASFDPQHPLYGTAVKHLQSVVLSDDVYVPSTILLECDLVLKGRGFSQEERSTIFEKLANIIPEDKVLPLVVEILKKAVEMEHETTYFDALVAATALKQKADIISTDHIFPKQGITTIW